MSVNLVQIIAIIAICLLPANKVYSIEEESCVSYGPGAGSHVYPGGSRSDGHQLQYTKAVSEYWNWNKNAIKFNQIIIINILWICV